jgi:hypothetical protein
MPGNETFKIGLKLLKNKHLSHIISLPPALIQRALTKKKEGVRVETSSFFLDSFESGVTGYPVAPALFQWLQRAL